ncbi:type 1 phosphatases regulator ypi1 [Aspergillus niger]|nr:type 1 phosphatases regulator ypi1 [Aspergillus niger]
MSRTRQIPSEPASSSQLELTEHTETSSAVPVPATLRLRGADEPAANRLELNEGNSRRIRWSEDVIDNEGMGKKSSKVCCIYHKSRPIGDSSSESESSDSSTSNSDTDSDDEAACHRRTGHRPPTAQGENYASSGQGLSSNSEERTCRSSHRARKTKRKPSPNAYEKMPKTTKGR